MNIEILNICAKIENGVWLSTFDQDLVSLLHLLRKENLGNFHENFNGHVEY